MSNKINSKLPLYRRGKKNQISLRKTFDGKQRWVALKTESVREAENLSRRFIKTEGIHGFEFANEELNGKAKPVREGEKVDLNRIKQLYDEYNQHLPTHRTKEVSRKSYIAALSKMLKSANIDFIEEIDPFKLYAGWRSANPNQADITFYAEVRKCSSLFKGKALAFYKSKGFSITNPFAAVETPKVIIERYEPMDRALYKKICACEGLSSSQAMIVKLAAMLGLRRGEIQMAQKSWLTDSAFRIPDRLGGWIPKSGVGRKIPLLRDFKAMFDSLRGQSESPFLIVGTEKKSGDRLKPELAFVVQWLRNLGVDDRKPLHLLRKEAGSLMATNHPQTIFAAKEFLGHSSVTTTEKHYAHLVDPVPYDPFQYV